MDGTVGTAVAEPRPLARNASSESSPSLISQIPIPSTPASVYARTSSAKLAASVLTCEIENRSDSSDTLDTRSRDRVTRLTSDQVWFTLGPRGDDVDARRRGAWPPDDGRGCTRAV